MRKLIKNGTIITSEREFKSDLLIKRDKIERIGKNIKVEYVEIYDAEDMYLLTGS